jgi:hypothetical protein
LCVTLCVAAANSFEGRTSQAKILGRGRVAPHSSVAQFGDVCFACKRYFVEAVRTVNHEGAPHAQFAERSRDNLGQACRVDAYDLRRSTRGIRQRAQQIENRAHAQFTTRGHRVARRRMQGGRE